MPVWLIQVLIAIAIDVVSYMLTPRPKQSRAAASQDLQDPTAETGKPIAKVFGTVLATSPNLLWYGDKSKTDREIST